MGMRRWRARDSWMNVGGWTVSDENDVDLSYRQVVVQGNRETRVEKRPRLLEATVVRGVRNLTMQIL